MTPRQCIIIGAVVAIVCGFGAMMLHETPTLTFLMFGAGALFGKGYGILEERGHI